MISVISKNSIDFYRSNIFIGDQLFSPFQIRPSFFFKLLFFRDFKLLNTISTVSLCNFFYINISQEYDIGSLILHSLCKHIR